MSKGHSNKNWIKSNIEGMQNVQVVCSLVSVIVVVKSTGQLTVVLGRSNKVYSLLFVWKVVQKKLSMLSSLGFF